MACSSCRSLVKYIRDADGELVYEHKPQVVRRVYPAEDGSQC